jgi:hypothetical protein
VTGSGSLVSPNEKVERSFANIDIPDSFVVPGIGIIEIALYGHCVAQSPQPIQVSGWISIEPSGNRAIAPVGQPVRHSGS